MLLNMLLQIEDCLVCSENTSSVLFKPCNHMVACESCAAIMKKCVECRTPIQETIPFNVCCGGKIGNYIHNIYNTINGFKMGSLHWGNTKITFQFKAMLIPNRPMLVVQKGQEVGRILVTGVEGMIVTLPLRDHLLITLITTTRISHLKETTLPILPWTTVEKILPILMFRNYKSS